MYIPNAQSIITAGLALTGTLTKRELRHFPDSHHMLYSNGKTAESVSKGEVLDFAVEKCIDSDGNKRCTTPFLVIKDTCYKLEWSTEGTVSHTTVEVRDAGSGEMVYYRDTNGEWTPEKGEVCYVSSLVSVPTRLSVKRMEMEVAKPG